MATLYSSQNPSLAGLAGSPSVSSLVSAALPTRNAPAGTLPPGTQVTVGKHSVTIDRWLSEGKLISRRSSLMFLGGFAHVYVVRLSAKMKLADGSVGDIACLKRVVVPDKEALAIVRTEVDTMVRPPLLSTTTNLETVEGPSPCGNVH